MSGGGDSFKLGSELPCFEPSQRQASSRSWGDHFRCFRLVSDLAQTSSDAFWRVPQIRHIANKDFGHKFYFGRSPANSISSPNPTPVGKDAIPVGAKCVCPPALKFAVASSDRISSIFAGVAMCCANFRSRSAPESVESRSAT